MDEELDELTRTIKEGVNLLKEVKHIADKLTSSAPKQVINSMPIQQPVSDEIPFVFTGQYTDLQYFQNNKILPHASINSLQDEELKAAVVSNFEMASREGLVSIDKENHFITLTENGKAYISTPEFKDVARKDQLEAVAKLKNALNNSSSTVTATTGNAVVDGAVIAAKAVGKTIQNI